MSCEAFCEAEIRNYPTGCCGGAWSRAKVKSGTGDDWMSGEARYWGRATQTGPRDMDLVLAEHRGLCGLTGCGRLRGAQWESCCIGCRPNTRLQWMGAAPGLVS